MESNQRISIKRKPANPLFKLWLEELYEEAQNNNSKITPNLKEALESIDKYPLPIKTGAECSILKGFGKKLCMFIDMRLEVYKGYNGLCILCNGPSTSITSVEHECKIIKSNSENKEQPQNCRTEISKATPNFVADDSEGNTSSNDQHNSLPLANTTNDRQISISKVKKYKPAYRSGGYAIMRALLDTLQETSTCLTKEALIEQAQKYSDESFVRPKPGTYYTAWSNMSRLLTKGYVVKQKNNKGFYYTLTQQGILVANDLSEDSQHIPSTNDIIFNSHTVPLLDKQENAKETSESEPSTQATQLSQTQVEFIKMPAGSFEIILLIDKNEISGVKNKNDPTVAQFNKYPDLKHEYRSLKVGDFTWIAQSKINKDQELVLPFVVERKRMDDLGSSIKDGRFHEQKFRLRKCGLKNVIYLVENYGRNTHVGLPLTSLTQALVNTRVQDGFKIHITDSLNHSCRFLAMMTKRLTLEFKDRDFNGCNSEATDGQLMTFQYFSKSSAKSKPLTITDTFIKLLLQLKGVSVEKALAITNVYKTPASLISAYQNCTDLKEATILLANLKYGSTNRNVGPSVSKALHHLFSIK